MPQLREMNDSVSLMNQMQANDDGSVVLINIFTIDPADEDALIEAWSADANFMKKQPGYISTQLHKGIGGSMTFLNYAVWESAESFAKAFQNPEFQKHISTYPASATISPHLFHKMGVDNLCVA